LELDQATTIDNFTNATVGRYYTFVISQDVTGSRTLAWGSNYFFEGGTAPTQTATASATDVYHFVYSEAAFMFIASAHDLS